MGLKLWLSFFALLFYFCCCLFNVVSSYHNCQTNRTNDLIDDCKCRMSDLDKLNNERLYKLLRRIAIKNYFRFFPVNIKKTCQFWQSDGQCALKECAVKSCPIENVPISLRETYNGNKIGVYQQLCEDSQCLLNTNTIT